jgi:hypothetical protein
MMFVYAPNNTVQEILNEDMLRAAFPETAFPVDMSNAELPKDYYDVRDTEIPAWDKATEKIVEEMVIEFGHCWKKYTVAKLNAEELIAHNARKWSELRYLRNVELQRTDWMMLPDTWETFTDKQKRTILDYRSELRNITEGSDPFSITIKPFEW